LIAIRNGAGPALHRFGLRAATAPPDAWQSLAPMWYGCRP
jgi:hypothetical protein